MQLETSSTKPTGLARRNNRLSEEETERRMLEAAMTLVARSGLTVSLDHLSLEEVIREAGVSRSAVYRRWPYKDLFFSDLVKELAKNAVPSIVEDEVAVLREVVAQRGDWLESRELRNGLIAELVRRLAVLDFEILYQSTKWRTYLALNATFASIADADIRAQVASALVESERAHTTRVAGAWEFLAGLLGFRLREDSCASFEALATVLSATMRGLVLMALSDPDIASHRASARPFGASDVAEWSLPALSFASIANGFLEEDMRIEWNDDRIREARESLDSMTAGGL
jgi:AcrR family transcriptional regulator